MRILFCIATNHNPVNINPLLEIKPDEVVVVITDDMQQKGQVLLDEIKSLQIVAKPLRVKNESSLQALNQQFSTWLEANIDHEIIVNITGGTKLMSLAAYQLFSSWESRCFYCDKDSNQLIWLDDESSTNIGMQISLERYLAIYQYKIIQKSTLADIPREYKQYAKILYNELCKPGKYNEICEFIGKVHALTEKKQNDSRKYIRFSQNEDAFLQYLESETKIFEYKGKEIVCNNENIRKIMNGGWLEISVAAALYGGKYRDIHLGVSFEKGTQRRGKTTKQELDVMAMFHDKLLIVECKARKWERTAEASEAIYKLKALGDIGGLNTLPVFVSLRELSPDAKTRAAELGIHVITGQANFKALKAKLEDILN